MRDRTKRRKYSAEADEFRREHERRRTWGLTQRHSRKLRRLYGHVPDDKEIEAAWSERNTAVSETRGNEPVSRAAAENAPVSTAELDLPPTPELTDPEPQDDITTAPDSLPGGKAASSPQAASVAARPGCRIPRHDVTARPRNSNRRSQQPLRRVDALAEVANALLCTDGPGKIRVGLLPAPERRRGHGAGFDALNHGRVDVETLRRQLNGLPLSWDVPATPRPPGVRHPGRIFPRPGPRA